MPPALADKVITATKLLGLSERDTIVLEQLEPGE